MPSREEIEAQLISPGGPCELVWEEVLGEKLRVFKSRKRSLRELLAASERFADAEYLIYEDRRIGYAQHLRQVASIARAFQERYGIGPGDRVAILAANRPEWIQSFWAATSIGAIAVGLNGWWAADEILYGLEDAEPALLIGDAKRLARLKDHDVRIPVLEMESGFRELEGYAPAAELSTHPIAEDDAACILYTSGTTGRPKGAVNTHRNILALIDVQIFHGIRLFMVAAAEAGASAQPSTPLCTLVTTPLFHVSGLYTGAITPLANGLKTVWTSGRFDPVEVMRLIAREKVSNWGPMGTMAHRVVTHPDVGKHDLSSLRAVGSGGAPTSPELQEKLRSAFPGCRKSLGLGYGLTESTALATLTWGEELVAHPDTVGRPLPTVEIEIRDEEGKARAEGEEGEVYIRGPLIMREYWRRPEDSARILRRGRWLRSGDIGRLEDGRLYINSRARDLILRGGENIYPIEIEQRIEAHPDVDEAAVIGVEHAELGQEVKAIVVARAAAALDPRELERWVAERLAHFKVPAHWELRSEPLPRNAAGKVLKNLLRSEERSPLIEE